MDMWRAISAAVKEASGTCQTCPSPGLKRVVWDWDSRYGWVVPWVKTCCDGCYHVPEHLRNASAYRDLVEQYEEPAPSVDRITTSSVVTRSCRPSRRRVCL